MTANAIVLSSGVLFDPTDPDVSVVTREDLVWGMVNTCRWSGQMPPDRRWSVADHTLAVMAIVPKKWKLEALLHDASEALGLADLPRPVKYHPALTGYRQIEDQLSRRLAERFGATYPWPDEVKAADDRVMMAEARDLIGITDPARHPLAWPRVAPVEDVIHPRTPRLLATILRRCFDVYAGDVFAGRDALQREAV